MTSLISDYRSTVSKAQHPFTNTSLGKAEKSIRPADQTNRVEVLAEAMDKLQTIVSHFDLANMSVADKESMMGQLKDAGLMQ
jgi:hypothetical protein